MYNKILVPIDNSILSSKVLLNAVRFAKDQKAELVILNVEVPKAGAFSTAIVYNQESMNADDNPVIKEVKAKLANEPLPIHYKVAAGNAADCIITACDTERCDLIIIGSHGFTGLSRLFAASNSVADRADVPVLIIK